MNENEKNDVLLMPLETEFLAPLNVLLGAGMFGEIKPRLVGLALETIRISLLGHTHPFETLRGLTDLQWEDLLENPSAPSLLNQLLDALDLQSELQDLLRRLRQPEVMQRLRVEWLYEMTVGRFEHTVPYLYKEEDLLKDWEAFCRTSRDSSINPFVFAGEQAERAAAIHGTGHSESAKRLFRLSFMAACRKLFVFFSGARETWIGACMREDFDMGSALSGLLGAQDNMKNDRLCLRFGLVDHVYYLTPTMGQNNRYVECVKHLDFILTVQQKLCPFVALAGEGPTFNLLAEVFYRVYHPQRLRELHSAPVAPQDNGFLERTGLSPNLFAQMRFIPMNESSSVPEP